jgi:hypothetical protein
MGNVTGLLEGERPVNQVRFRIAVQQGMNCLDYPLRLFFSTQFVFKQDRLVL